jgi:hypothetical protein
MPPCAIFAYARRRPQEPKCRTRERERLSSWHSSTSIANTTIGTHDESPVDGLTVNRVSVNRRIDCHHISLPSQIDSLRLALKAHLEQGIPPSPSATHRVKAKIAQIGAAARLGLATGSTNRVNRRSMPHQKRGWICTITTAAHNKNKRNNNESPPPPHLPYTMNIISLPNRVLLSSAKARWVLRRPLRPLLPRLRFHRHHHRRQAKTAAEKSSIATVVSSSGAWLRPESPLPMSSLHPPLLLASSSS